MKDVPEVLDKMVDAVLAYKPKPKSRAAKKRGRKAAKKAKAQPDDSQIPKATSAASAARPGS
jgi:hypothetical protein